MTTKFDYYSLGPRFYRLEFERLIAMRRLSLQKYPLDISEVNKDIVFAVESVVKATMVVSEELAIEARKVSTYLKSVDTMTSRSRVTQIISFMEQLENTLQCLIRYGWLIEREWNVYVRPNMPGSDNPRRSSRNSVFPTNYLRSLGPWHMAISGAITRARFRANDISYGNVQPADSGISWRNFGSVVFAPSPTHWCTSYVVERAKTERTKGKKLDSWLENVPPVTSPKPGQRSCTQATDICRRNALHYAAIAPVDLLWLKRMNYLDRQDVRPQSEATRLPPLAMPDILGHTPLTLAARSGNVGAVKYIVDESGIDAVCESLVDAAALASAGKHIECLVPIVDRMMQFPDKLSLALRLAVFNGFLPLLDLLCAKLAVADGATRSTAEEALERDLARSGGCSLFHLAAFNDQAEVIRHLLSNNADSAAAAFKAGAANNGGLTPLDISNYLGFVECAAVLIGATTPAAALSDAGDAGMQIPAIVPVNGGPGTPPETHAVFVTLGTNDTRRFPAMPPITFDTEALNSLLDENDLPRSTHLLLRVDSEQGMEKNNDNGWIVDVDAMLRNPAAASAGAWQPFAHFYTVYPDRFVLKLELIALIDQALLPYSSDQKVIAHSAVTVPASCPPDDSKTPAKQPAPMRVSNSSSYMHSLLLSTTSSTIAGEVHLEVVVATPYSHPNFGREDGHLQQVSAAGKLNSKRKNKPRSLGSSSRTSSDGDELASGPGGASRRSSLSERVADSLSWRQDGATLVYGHRGSGKNFSPADNAFSLQLGENTVLSMQQAVRDGAMAVEFDVQLTRDMVPVIYHDWNVAETGLDVPVNSLTLKQFMSYGPQSKSLARTRSHSNIDSLGQSLALHANSNDTVRAPFATLEDLFESLPESVGFDIEIKYPMPDEADEAGIDTNFEMNQFVDRILDIVFKHTPSLPKQSLAEFSDDERPERRPIVFTSFHPDICLLLAHKIDGEFPIMFLTDAGRTTMADARCNSLVAAVRLCRRMGLAGIVTYAAPIVESPRVAHMVRRNNLALATYGRQNNRREMVLIQKSAGVDIVITDKVRLAAAAVQTA